MIAPTELEAKIASTSSEIAVRKMEIDQDARTQKLNELRLKTLTGLIQELKNDLIGEI
jgi:hypothetical protein